jgi:hypothetical protein
MDLRKSAVMMLELQALDDTLPRAVRLTDAGKQHCDEDSMKPKALLTRAPSWAALFVALPLVHIPRYIGYAYSITPGTNP